MELTKRKRQKQRKATGPATCISGTVSSPAEILGDINRRIGFKVR
jgi:hypothetical protein